MSRPMKRQSRGSDQGASAPPPPAPPRAAAALCAAALAALVAGGCQLILGIGGELPLEVGGGGAGGDGGQPCEPGTEGEGCGGSGRTTWIRTVTGQVQGVDVGVDGAGRVVAAAMFSGEVDFGDGDPVTAKDETDAALLAYDRTGALLWKRVFSAPGQQAIQAIHVDAEGHVALAGHTYGNLDLGGAAGTIGGGGFVARLDPDGNTLWSRLVQSKESAPVVSFVTQGSNGDVILGGNGPDVDLGAGPPLTSGDPLSFYVARLAGATGEVEWAKITHGPAKEGLGAVAVDASGRVVLAGTFESEHLALDGDDLENPTGADVPFVARLSPDGAYLEGAVFADSPGVLTMDPNDMALDGLGVPVVVGVFHGEIQLASGTYDAADRPSAFVVRDPANGRAEWSRAYMDAKGLAGAAQVAVGARDDIVVAGVYGGRMDFGQGPAPEDQDGFLLALDPEGELLWLQTFSLGKGTVRAVAKGSLEDETVLAGTFYDHIDLGGVHVQAPQGMFVAKLGD